MKYVLTNEQMRTADKYTIEELGVPSLELMERAGRALAREAEDMLALGGKKIRERVLCVCGGGNNGGDGFVCARILNGRGVETDVVSVAEKRSLECRENYEKFVAAGGRVLTKLPERGYAVVVDCLLGTGFHGELCGELLRAAKGINALKAQGAKVLSADIPSGVNGDNGEVKTAVIADRTLCIGERKAGAYLGDGIDCAGEIVCADIGIKLPDRAESYALLTDRESVAALVEKRKRNTHKGSYGRAAIVAGSAAYTGAAYLATAACLRAGAGYTALFAPKGILPYYMLKAPEALLAPICEGENILFEESGFGKLLGYDSVAYGMGCGVSRAVSDGAKYLLKNYAGKLILDADALNSLAAYEKENFAELFGEKKCDTAITPHCKEFSRLTGESVETILKNGLSAPAAFAKEYGVCVLLKNAVSVLTDGERTAVNAAGCAGQAKGGSGDVLSGVIASLCASGLTAFDGARAGAYLVGRAAELAAKEVGEYSLVASDVVAYLGRAFLELRADQE